MKKQINDYHKSIEEYLKDSNLNKNDIIFLQSMEGFNDILINKAIKRFTLKLFFAGKEHLIDDRLLMYKKDVDIR